MSEESPEKGDGAFAQESPGARLRAAREARKLRLEEVAESLGLGQEVVAALEADEYGRLGAPVYVRGYLRKYARLLALDGNELVREYELEASPRDPEVLAHVTSGLPRRNIGRWLALAAATVVVIALVFGGIWAWRYMRHSRAAAPASTASIPVHPATARTGTAVPEKSTRAGVLSPATRPGAAANKTPSTAETGIRLTLAVHQACWIEVSGVGGERLYYNLAPAGKTLNFQAARGMLKVFLGNADGVSVTVNGKAFPIPAGTRSGNTARFVVEPSSAPASASAT